VDAEWVPVLAIGTVSVVVRLIPEAWLRGRAPPQVVADALPWLPACVAGALLGALHFGAPSEVQVEYLLAAGAASLTLLWRRSFYLPIVAGALVLALLRHSSWFSPGIE
jgi:branched-subunit amino acid transport protein